MHVVQAVRVGRNEVTAPWPSANDNRLHPKGMGPVVIVAAQHSNPRTARSAGRKGGEERSDGSLASANDTGLQLCRRADHSDGGTAHQSEMRARASGEYFQSWRGATACRSRNLGEQRSPTRRAWALVGAGCLVAAGLAAAVPTAAQASTVVNFTTVGATTWTVPTGVTSVDVVAIGGSGATASSGFGGLGGSGARVSATMTVTGGQSLSLFVGGGAEAGHASNGGGGSSSVNAGTVGNQIIAGGGGGGMEGGDGGAGGGASGAGNDGGGTSPGGGGSGGTGGTSGGGGASNGGDGNGGPGGGFGGGQGPMGAAYGGYGSAGDNQFGQGGAGGGGFGGGAGSGGPGGGGGAGGSIGTAGAVYVSAGLSPSADGSIQLTYTTPANDAQLVVNATSKKKLPRSGTTTVVRSAKVTPSSAGSLRSIKVTCKSSNGRVAPRGDVRYCSHTKNLNTGKVKVTTYGSKNVRVKVTIVSEPSTQGGETLRWKQSWAVK